MQLAPPLSIQLLGPFTVKPGDSGPPIDLRRKTRALLAYLAALDRPVSRTALADMFCQDAQDPHAALRSILSRVRRRLPVEVFIAEGDAIRVDNTVVWTDCREFFKTLDGDLTQVSLERLAAVVDLYHGPFLENVTLESSPEFELWLLNERARYQRLYERSLGELVNLLVELDELESATGYAQALLRSNPLSEETHGRLMWLYARSGRRATALEQFEQCRALLAAELAVEPGAALIGLRDSIAAGDLRRPDIPSVVPVQPAPLNHEATQYVGRAAELAQLRQVWDQSHAAHTAVVLLEAEAGMGKTRLVHEFARSLPEATFLSGACYESTRALTFLPWLELLESQLERLDERGLVQLSSLSADYLARLLPALARRLGRGRPPLLPTSGGELNRLFTAVAEFLLELHPAGPLLLFIDNLQWADEASLQLFHFLARRPSRNRLMLCGALRTEEAGDAPALQALISDLQQSLLRIQLPPLTVGAIGRLADRLWPGLPQGYRPDAMVMLAGATGGNPLFVTEILRELAHTDELPAALPIPRSVSELIQRRLQRLPPSSRQVVEAMAILDSPATLLEAQQIGGRSADETITAVDLALQRGLLQPIKDTAPARYAFGHDLMREAVLDRLTHVRRQVLHRRAALALERVAPPGTLAHHWQMAGDAEKEAHYAALAGEQAAAVFANAEAVRYLQRALLLLTDPERRLQIMARLGDVWVLTGAWDSAEDAFTRGLALATERDNRHQQAHFQHALGKLMSRKGLYEPALAFLQDAREAYEAVGDQGGVANCIGTVGIVHWQKDDYDQALACYRQALDIETARDNKQGIAVWTGNVASVYEQKGDYQQALAYSERSLQLRRELGMQLIVGIETGNMGSTYYAMGLYLKALDHHREALRIRHELGDKPGVATVLGYVGRDYAGLGDGGTALACFHAALKISLELGNLEGIALNLGRIGEHFAAEDDHQQALAYLDRAVTFFRRLGAPYYLSKRLTSSASSLFALCRYDAAQNLNDEALALAVEEDQTVQFAAQLLALRLRLALRQLEKTGAQETLISLLPEFDRPAQQAAIHYEIWRCDPTTPFSQRHAASAARLFHYLYHQTYRHSHRRRYEELTGNSLPDPPPLPPRSKIIPAGPPDPASLLHHVDSLLASLNPGT